MIKLKYFESIQVKGIYKSYPPKQLGMVFDPLQQILKFHFAVR